MQAASCKITTWNVNSIHVRLREKLAWIAQELPDVLLLQETKCGSTLRKFPVDAFGDIGYDVVHVDGFGKNGVAIAARTSLTEVVCDPVGARWIQATAAGIQYISAYAPARSQDHKLEWLQKLAAHVERCATRPQPVVVAGDFNIALDPKLDIQGTQDQTLLAERRVLRDWPLVDALRQFKPERLLYTWHRPPAALRLDYHFISRTLLPTIYAYDTHPVLLSDHDPVTLTLNSGLVTVE